MTSGSCPIIFSIGHIEPTAIEDIKDKKEKRYQTENKERIEKVN